jgi:hypothetical protein
MSIAALVMTTTTLVLHRNPAQKRLAIASGLVMMMFNLKLSHQKHREGF